MSAISATDRGHHHLFLPLLPLPRPLPPPPSSPPLHPPARPRPACFPRRLTRPPLILPLQPPPPTRRPNSSTARRPPPSSPPLPRLPLLAAPPPPPLPHAYLSVSFAVFGRPSGGLSILFQSASPIRTPPPPPRRSTCAPPPPPPLGHVKPSRAPSPPHPPAPLPLHPPRTAIIPPASPPPPSPPRIPRHPPPPVPKSRSRLCGQPWTRGHRNCRGTGSVDRLTARPVVLATPTRLATTRRCSRTCNVSS